MYVITYKEESGKVRKRNKKSYPKIMMEFVKVYG